MVLIDNNLYTIYTEKNIKEALTKHKIEASSMCSNGYMGHG